jgi:hypothetical protein
METSTLIIIGLILVAALYYVKYLYVENFDPSKIEVVNTGQPPTIDTGSNTYFDTIEKQAMERHSKIEEGVLTFNPVYDKIKNSMNDILKNIKEMPDNPEKDAKIDVLINILLASNVFKDIQPADFEKAYPDFASVVKKMSARNKGGVKIIILQLIHLLNYLDDNIYK